jgi:hypothetical protein
VELSCCAIPVRLLENLGAQPTLLPLFPGASKIADRLAGLHSLLRVGQPHGDPHAGLNTLMKDVGLARGEYSGAGLPGRRAAVVLAAGCGECGDLVGADVVLVVVAYFFQQRFMASRQATLEYLTTTKIGEKGQVTVPKQFRRDLGLEAAAPLAVLSSPVAFFYLGPRQSRFVDLCGAALQTGPGGGCSR